MKILQAVDVAFKEGSEHDFHWVCYVCGESAIWPHMAQVHGLQLTPKNVIISEDVPATREWMQKMRVLR